jgi:hypothetical protein
MKIKEIENNSFTLNCDRQELIILNNALNNIPQSVGEGEYTTLIGATKEEADALLSTIHKALATNH